MSRQTFLIMRDPAASVNKNLSESSERPLAPGGKIGMEDRRPPVGRRAGSGDPRRTKQIRNESSRGQKGAKTNFAACHRSPAHGNNRHSNSRFKLNLQGRPVAWSNKEGEEA